MNETTTQIMERLDLLAAKLGVTAEHMWEVLTTQGTVEGIYGLAYAVTGMIGLSLCIWLLNRQDDDCDDGVFGLFVGLGLISLVVAIFGVTDTKYLFNPEYFALKKITGFLK